MAKGPAPVPRNQPPTLGVAEGLSLTATRDLHPHPRAYFFSSTIS